MNLLREESKDIYVYQKLLKLTFEERESILLDVLSEEADFDSVDILSPKYNHLIREYLKEELVGVTNEFLETEIRINLKVSVEISGEAEILEKCNCCGYRTLTEKGSYLICPVCFWEDDGTSDLDNYSAVNRGTLREYKQKLEGSLTNQKSKYYK